MWILKSGWCFSSFETGLIVWPICEWQPCWPLKLPTGFICQKSRKDQLVVWGIVIIVEEPNHPIDAESHAHWTWHNKHLWIWIGLKLFWNPKSGPTNESGNPHNVDSGEFLWLGKGLHLGQKFEFGDFNLRVYHVVLSCSKICQIHPFTVFSPFSFLEHRLCRLPL